MISYLLRMYSKYYRRNISKLMGYYPIREREREFIIENIDHKKKYKILDVGCYGSILPIQLAKYGHDVYGIDVININVSKFKFYCIDLLHDIVPDNNFEYISLLSTIEHIGIGYYGDQKDESGDRVALQKLYNALNNTGKILLTIPYSGEYKQSDFQRIHTENTFNELTEDIFYIEKEKYYIPINKKKWVESSKTEAQKAYQVYPESNNACFVLRKVL